MALTGMKGGMPGQKQFTPPKASVNGPGKTKQWTGKRDVHKQG